MTSRKLIICLLASMVMRNPLLLKMRHISFLMFSVSLGVALVTRKDNNTTETYIGLTENDFKTRYRNHTASFRHAKHRNSTELSKHIWTLKDNNIEHFISWRILASHSPYNSSSKSCNLCLKEKLLIICRPELSTLNKRNELVSSCRHRNKTLLRNN